MGLGQGTSWMDGLASRFCTRVSGLAVLEMSPAGFDTGPEWKSRDKSKTNGLGSIWRRFDEGPAIIPLGVLCPRAKSKVDEDDSPSHWQYMAFLLLTSKSKGVQFAWRPATVERRSTASPATWMLLATRRKSRAAGRQAATNLNSLNPLYSSEN